MRRITCSQTLASAKKQITNSRSAIFSSKKRIYQGNMLVSNSKKTITSSNYLLISSVFFLTNYFLITTLQDWANFLHLESIPARHKNAFDSLYYRRHVSPEQIRQVLEVVCAGLVARLGLPTTLPLSIVRAASQKAQLVHNALSSSRANRRSECR